MQVSKKQLGETGVELTVVATASEIADVKRSVFNKLRGQVKADGFRPGKAPDNIVEQQLGSEAVQAEVVDGVLNRTYPQAVADAKIQVIGQPEVALKKFVPYSDLEYTATVEIMPSIKLPDYKKFKAKVEQQAVTDKDIDEVLERMRQQLASKKPVARAAKEGDEVTIDFTGTDSKGETIPGAAGKDLPVTIGSGGFIPGFEAELIGLKKGAQKTFQLTFPKDYHASALQGAKVSFDATVKDVKEIVKRELNDEFAKQASPLKTLDALKADIRKQLELEFAERAERARREDLVRQLVEGAKVPLPPKLLARVLEEIKHEFHHNLERRGLSEEDFYKSEGTTAEEYEKKELMPAAERRVKGSLTLSDLARIEAVNVSSEELETTIETLKQRYKNDQATLAELDKPAAREDIALQTLTERTIDKLVEYASTK